MTNRKKLCGSSVRATKISRPPRNSTIDATPTVAHTAYYAQLVRQKHESRRLRGMLEAEAEGLRSPPAPQVAAARRAVEDAMRRLGAEERAA